MRETNEPINDIHSALRYFVTRCLRGDGRIIDQVDGAKGAIAYRVRNGRSDILRRVDHYMMFFKRENLHSFQHIFPGMKGSGEGQTINMRALRKAVSNKDHIAIVMPDGSVSIIDAGIWLDFAVNNNTIRVPSTETGEEASVPVSMLVSWDTHLADCNASRVSTSATKGTLDNWFSSGDNEK